MKYVSTSIDIAVSPERVWRVLTDFPRHAEWNPFIRSISGNVREGERLVVRIQPPGGKGMTFKPVVLSAKPCRELRWKGKVLLPGLFDGEHFFEMDATEGGTRFRHGESFSGALTTMLSAASLQQIKRGFIAMNDAIKMRAERQD